MVGEWNEAWNRRDLATVIQHFHEDVVFLSPKAADITGNGAIRGRAALLEYWQSALALVTDLHFEIRNFLWDPDQRVLTILYKARLNGRISDAAEVLQLDEDNLVIRGEAFYGVAEQ